MAVLLGRLLMAERAYPGGDYEFALLPIEEAFFGVLIFTLWDAVRPSICLKNCLERAGVLVLGFAGSSAALVSRHPAGWSPFEGAVYYVVVGVFAGAIAIVVGFTVRAVLIQRRQ